MQKAILVFIALSLSFLSRGQFSYTASSVCVPATVIFTDNTSGTIINRVWDFGSVAEGGAISSTNTVGHNYLTYGTFTVMLTVEFADHNKQTFTQTINIRPAPVADFTASTYAGCKSLKVDFYDASTTSDGTITKWLWDLGDGTANPSQNPSTTYTANGLNNVSLIAYNSFGCKSPAVTKQVAVYDNAVASFTIDKTKDCTAPADFTFTNTSTGQGIKNYTWNFGNGIVTDNSASLVHPYNTAGQYMVLLNVVNGTNCSKTSPSQTVYVGTPQVSNMTIQDAACTGTSVPFSASVLPSSFTGCTYKWVFSDGTTYYGPSNSKTFSVPGTYTVTLTITNAGGCVSDPVTKSITIKQTPVASFDIDKTVLCKEPYTANFTNTGSTSGNYSYNWNFGDGVTDATENPQHTYAANATDSRTVTLTVTDNDAGCSNTKSFSYMRIGPPQVTLQKVDPNSGCKPLPVTATSSVSTFDPGAITYAWDFGDGIVSTTTPSADFTYTTAGSKSVSVTITTTSGCTATSASLPVTVTETCTDDGSGGGGGGGGGFKFDAGSCAAKFTVKFTDTLSQKPANNLIITSWDFGDGVVDNTTPGPTIVTHTYPDVTTATYIVTVTRKNTVTDEVTTFTKNIVIINEKPAFTVSKSGTCTQDPITFTPQGIHPEYIQKYDWKWEAGTSSTSGTTITSNYNPTIDGHTSHQYGNTGVYEVMLTITDKSGCPSSVVYDSIHIGGPTASFSGIDLTSCKEQTFSKLFTDASIPNGSIPIVKWDWYVWNTGTAVPNSPTLSLNATTMINPVQLSFLNTYHNFTQYSVKLIVTDQNGCSSAPDSQSAIVKSYWPKANIYTTPIVTCNQYTFNFYNYYSSGQSPTFKWNFGDNSFSTQPSPSHTYTQDGSYNVTLIATETALPTCADTTVQSNLIQIIKPKASFTVSNLDECAPIAVNFINTSAYANSSSWTFGDGGVGSTLMNPSGHIYRVGGDYTITLKVTGPNGCTNTIDSVIHIKGPNGTYTYGDLIGCNPFTFTGNVSGTNVNTFAWDFRDGTLINTPATTNTLSHTYTQAGIYRPNIILSSDDGCSYTLEMKPEDKVIVDEIHASLATDQNTFCKAGSVTFTDAVTVPAFSSITNYLWTFGDGSTATGSGPVTHPYTNPGTFSAALSVESQYGCTTIVNASAIVVHATPIPIISGDDIVCLSQQGPLLQYSNTGTSDDAIASSKWMIDGNVVGTDANLSLDYRIPGNHIVSLTVTTSNGCDSTVTKNIIIDSVRANFTVDKLKFCGTGDPVFINISTVAPTSAITSYLWSFGDGNTSTDADPGVYHYGTPNNYNVTLSVESQNGCTQTSEPVTIIVHPIPSATITGDDIVCLLPQGPLLQYTSAISSVDDIQTYQWLIDGNAVSTDANLSLDYRVTGNHVLSLTVTTINGCDFTVTKNIIIDSVRANFTVDQSNFCGTGDPVFTNTSTVAPTSAITDYLWNFGDSNTSALQNPVYTYSNPGSYSISLHAVSSNGCTSDTTLSQAIKVYSKPTLSITGPDEICIHKEGDYAVSVSSEDAVIAYTWKINNAIVPGTNTGMHSTFDVSGNYNIKYNVVTQYGCKDSAESALVVHPNPVIQMTANTTICKGENIQLTASGGVNYLWTGANLIGDITNPIISATPIADAKYVVAVTNNFGCTTSDSMLVKVDMPVGLTAIKDVTICKGASKQLWAAGNTSSFIWTPATGLSNDNIANPIASPDVTTTYLVRGVSGNVCADDLAQVTVNVSPLPTIHIGSDTTVVAGTQINLFANGSNNISQYLWSPSTGLNCTDCANPVFTANHDIVYTLSATTKDNCKVSQSIKVHVLCNEGAVYIPSAFTPNGDGKNDVFYILGSGIKIIKSFRVFNRFGNLVFAKENVSPNDRKAGWDGLVKGQPVNQSTTFVYTAEIICNEGKTFFLKGTVVLIR